MYNMAANIYQVSPYILHLYKCSFFLRNILHREKSRIMLSQTDKHLPSTKLADANSFCLSNWQ